MTEVIECDPDDYKRYFDWGEIGERIMERALELKKELSSNLELRNSLFGVSF